MKGGNFVLKLFRNFDSILPKLRPKTETSQRGKFQWSNLFSWEGMAATSLQPDSWRNATTPIPPWPHHRLAAHCATSVQQSLRRYRHPIFPVLTLQGDTTLLYPRYHNQTLNAQLKMSDVNTLLIEPLTKFVKDSAYLVKKCTKPDHKGISISIQSFTPCSTWNSRPYPNQSLTPADLLLTNFQNLLRSQELLDSDFWLWDLWDFLSNLFTSPSITLLSVECNMSQPPSVSRSCRTFHVLYYFRRILPFWNFVQNFLLVSFLYLNFRSSGSNLKKIFFISIELTMSIILSRCEFILIAAETTKDISFILHFSLSCRRLFCATCVH